MPEGYEKIKRSMRKSYPRLSEQEIKARAAATWNKKHPNNPVTGKHQSHGRKKK